MNKFGSTTVCPKCLYSELERKYNKQATNFHDEPIEAEYLILTCLSCGYVGKEHCADYDPAREQEYEKNRQKESDYREKLHKARQP